MLKYLVPRIVLADLPPMFGVAFIGAIIAGAADHPPIPNF